MASHGRKVNHPSQYWMWLITDVLLGPLSSGWLATVCSLVHTSQPQLITRGPRCVTHDLNPLETLIKDFPQNHWPRKKKITGQVLYWILPLSGPGRKHAIKIQVYRVDLSVRLWTTCKGFCCNRIVKRNVGIQREKRKVDHRWVVIPMKMRRKRTFYKSSLGFLIISGWNWCSFFAAMMKKF